MSRIKLITGVSASGKTTLQELLLQKWLNRPINFTTRPPRREETEIQLNSNDYIWVDFTAQELDEYVFLNREQFLKKLKNWDLLEWTNFNTYFYWVSNILPEGDVCIVVDPIWRSQIIQYCKQRNIEYETYYLEISPELQTERLNNRGDSEKSILARQKDFDWFSPTRNCTILDWAEDPEILADIILNK